MQKREKVHLLIPILLAFADLGNASIAIDTISMGQACRESVCCHDLEQEFDSFLQEVKKAMLCAWKISIDSSIQAQGTGKVMRRKWRVYGLFNTHACSLDGTKEEENKRDESVKWQSMLAHAE